jgi:thioredoxin reductase (NADPH)
MALFRYSSQSIKEDNPMQQPEIRQIAADVLVIGAGPAGATAGLYAARAGQKTVILAGKASSKLELDYVVENYPGFISINSRELLEKFRDHARQFGSEIIEADAMDINLDTDPKFVVTKQHMIEARSVIIATGRPSPSKDRIRGEEDLVGMGVSYCATCDGPLYRGKQVLAVGDSDEAAEDVLALRQMGVDVTWLTGDAKAIAVSPELVQEAESKGVTLQAESLVLAIRGQGRVEEVEIEQKGKRRNLPVEGVFIFRAIPFSSLYAKSGLKIDHRSCVVIDPAQNTNLDGVYAAGDITCGGLQIVTAAGEGARAAMSVLKYLRRKK